MNILTGRCKSLYEKVNKLKPDEIVEGNTFFGVEGTAPLQDFSNSTATPYQVLENKKFISNNELLVGLMKQGKIYNAERNVAFNVNALINQEYRKASDFYIRPSTISFIFNYWYQSGNTTYMPFSIPYYISSKYKDQKFPIRVEWLVGDTVLKTFNHTITGPSSSDDYRFSSSIISITLNEYLSITQCRVIFT